MHKNITHKLVKTVSVAALALTLTTAMAPGHHVNRSALTVAHHLDRAVALSHHVDPSLEVVAAHHHHNDRLSDSRC